MNRSWKWYLVVAQVTITLALGFWGSGQTERLLQQRGTFRIWDYVSPAEMVMHTLNAPVAVLCAATLSRSFQIGPEYSGGIFAVYVALSAVFWFFVGWLVWDYPMLIPTRPRLAKQLRIFGITGGAMLVVVGLGMLPGPWSLFFPLAMIVWGLVIGLLVARPKGARSAIDHNPLPSKQDS